MTRDGYVLVVTMVDAAIVFRVSPYELVFGGEIKQARRSK